MSEKFNKQLTAILDADDLGLMVRGHSFLQSLLVKSILEALPISHSVEIERLSFPLQVDLAIALGGLYPESRSSLLKFNSIRNSFAHDPQAELTDSHALELFNSLSDRQRRAIRTQYSEYDDKKEAVRNSFTVMCIELERIILQRREQELEGEILHEMVEEIRRNSPGIERPTRRDAEISRQVEARKRKNPSRYRDV